jgi:hypothetical protein
MTPSTNPLICGWRFLWQHYQISSQAYFQALECEIMYVKSQIELERFYQSQIILDNYQATQSQAIS